MINVAAVSGGKDSVAMLLYMRRSGLNPIAIYDDTEFEWEGHYAHLDDLERMIGPLIRTRPPYSLLDGVRRHGMFPKRGERWCTEELKIEPFRAELDRIRAETGDEVEVYVGVRREENKARSRLPAREWADWYDCYVVRPILEWKVEDVIREHRLAGVPMHPLYHQGLNRVGCFPCINAPKEEIAAVARIQPSRIDEIAAAEKDTDGTMFVLEETAKARRARGAKKDEPRKVFPTPIHEVVKWANTARGGKQFQLLPQLGGCVRWGVCETPPSRAEPRAATAAKKETE